MRCEETDNTQSHRFSSAQLWVGSNCKLVCLTGKALDREATRRLRFVVHAAGWLRSMVLHGRVRRSAIDWPSHSPDIILIDFLGGGGIWGHTSTQLLKT